MFEFRVTKYDPAHRNRRGYFLLEEWICASQIGQVFGGTVLTEAECSAVEDAYATAAVEFLREAEVPAYPSPGWRITPASHSRSSRASRWGWPRLAESFGSCSEVSLGTPRGRGGVRPHRLRLLHVHRGACGVPGRSGHRPAARPIPLAVQISVQRAKPCGPRNFLGG